MECKHKAAAKCSEEMHSGRMCKACYLAGQRERQAAYRAKTTQWKPADPLALGEKVELHSKNPMYMRWV